MRLPPALLAAGVLAACAASPAPAAVPEPQAHAAARQVTPHEVSRIEDLLSDANGAYSDAHHHVVRRQQDCERRAAYDAIEAIILAETRLVHLDDALYDRLVEAREADQDKVARRLRDAFDLTTGLGRAAQRLRSHIWDPCGSYDPEEARDAWDRHTRELRDLLRDVREDLR